MVRDILRRNHKAQVFMIQFGRRPKPSAPFYEKMLQFSQSLGARYGVHTVPVDPCLKRILPEVDFIQAYSDDMHDRRHVVTSFIGNHVAHFIAVALDALDLLDEPQKDFENSRFVESTVAIAAGTAVSFDVPGSLLLMRFVSGPTSCRVAITEGDSEPVIFDTLSKEVATGKFPFLIRSTPFTRRPWAATVKGKTNRITISVLPKEQDTPVNVVRGDMVGPTANRDLAFHLSSVLVW